MRYFATYNSKTKTTFVIINLRARPRIKFQPSSQSDIGNKRARRPSPAVALNRSNQRWQFIQSRQVYRFQRVKIQRKHPIPHPRSDTTMRQFSRTSLHIDTHSGLLLINLAPPSLR